MGHIHEKYDFVITLLIVHDSRVLLIHHPKYGMWLPIGGHIELDEDPEQALFREAEEETGLKISLVNARPSIQPSPDVKVLPTPNFLDVHEANPPHRHISLTYFAKADTDAVRRSDEHDDYKWLAEQELDDPTYVLSPSIKYYCHRAIAAAKA